MPDPAAMSKSASTSLRLQTELGWHPFHADRGVAAGFCCEYCGRDLLKSIIDYDAWQLDHVIPTSQGGKDEYENAALCCKTCNFMKRAYVPTGGSRNERIKDAKRYIEERQGMKESQLGKVREIAGYRPVTPPEA